MRFRSQERARGQGPSRVLRVRNGQVAFQKWINLDHRFDFYRPLSLLSVCKETNSAREQLVFYMNFLAKTIGTLTGTAIPYTFGEVQVVPKCESDSSASIWKVYDGVSDKDSRPVSIFEFDLRHPTNGRYIQIAKNAITKHRALSLLPGVLTVVDVIESDRNIYLITEHATALDKGALALKKGEALLGVYQLAVGLKFINIEGSSVHGNLRAGNVFINDSGEWKIGGFEFTLGWKDNADIYSLYSTYSTVTTHLNMPVPPEFEASGSEVFRAQLAGVKALKFDSFLLGVLAYQVLSGTSASEYKRKSVSTNLDGLPIGKLIAPSIGLRITAEQFLNDGQSSYFGSEEIVSFSKFSQIAIMDLPSKLEIFKALAGSDISTRFLNYRVMPEIVRTFDTITTNENNTQTILIYLIYLIVQKSEEKECEKAFDLFFKPLLFKAFTLADRAVRTILLKILPKVAERLTKYEIQDKIYPNLVTGFLDTDITVRTETLLSISYIMEKISDRQLNNDLLRYLAKLQADTNPKLRANTVVCLTRISEKMQPTTRIGVLITAFGKALKDPDYVTRLCAIRGFESSIDYFSPEICCSKVLSSLSPALLDKSSVIRAEAEKCFELYMKKIRDEASTLGQNEEDEHIESDVTSLDKLMESMSLENLGETILGTISTPSGTPFPQSRMSLNLNNSTSSLTDKLNIGDNVKNNYSKSNLKNVVDVNDDFDLEDENDDGWGFDEEEVVNSKPVISKATVSVLKQTPGSVPSVKAKAHLQTSSAKNAKKTLVLGKNKPVAKLDLNLTSSVDDEDDGWGDGW